MQKSNTRFIAPKPTKNGFLPPKTNPTRKVLSNESMGEWKHINWRKLERRVFKLQKRIYKASLRGDVKAFRRLQKTLMNSWAAKCLSVRRVTQDNQGKKTAGVDGIKSLSPEARLALVAKLKPNTKVKPTRRVWIPKPGTEDKRPLGIPVMDDRALQALFKLALEPEWEARFEPNSYGFRPGRSCHDAIEAIFNAREIISEWLKDMGLELKPAKTRLTHTLNEYELEKPGFNFLGFNVKQWKVGKYHSKQGFKTIITPSKEKQKIHYDRVASIIDDHKAAPQTALMSRLNPVIIGWSNYYSTVVSKETYTDLDNLMYLKLKAWAQHRHPKKNGAWVSKKYWQTIGDDNWVFATRHEGKNQMRLRSHAETPIVRFVKVKGEASPYDGNLIYWCTTMSKHPETTKRINSLLKSQKGKCTHCGLYL